MALAGRPTAFPGRLRQGQILRNLYEYVPTGPATADGIAEVTMVQHPLLVVISPECDLVSDYEARNRDSSSTSGQPQSNSNLLEHIQCCKLFEEGDIRRPHGINSAAWSFVKSNRLERYHMIPPNIPGRAEDSSPLYLDFKRILSIPTAYLYQILKAGNIVLGEIIEPPWIHQLVHRCYGFQSRVCVPDPTDTRPSAQA